MNVNVDNKTIVIMGVANKRSIAWGIATALYQAGARLIFTYAGERMEKGVRELVDGLEGGKDTYVIPCDVTSDTEIEKCFADIREKYGKIDGIAHCIASQPLMLPLRTLGRFSMTSPSLDQTSTTISLAI